MEPRMARRIGDLARARVPFAVCTVAATSGSVPGKQGATMIVTADGPAEGTVGGAGLEEKVKAAARDALKTRRGRVERFDLANWKTEGLDSVCGGTVTVAIDVVNPVPHLLFIGGGHCADALARLCAVLDWDHSVIDARPEFAGADRFPDAVVRHGGDPAAWLTAAAPDDLGQFTHAYLLGHDHHIDTAALIALVGRFKGHIGVIGSQAKKTSMFERARKADVSDDALARVRIPIGLDIGAETPPEIAVAVAAEIIKDARRS